MKISDVLDQIGQDVLTEDSKKILAEAFLEAVEASVNEKLELHIQNALTQLDEEHSEKLEKLLEAIDTDHTSKLSAVLEKVDADHASKLKFVIERYQKTLNKDAIEFKEQLTEQISQYLDLYLEDQLPKEEINEAVKNVQARKVLDKIKQVVAVDQTFIDETIKEAVQDGKETIDNLRRELNEAVKANIELSQSVKSTKANLILEQKTAGFSRDKKAFIMRTLAGKDPGVIEENFDYAMKMFEKDEDDQTQLLSEEAKSKSRIVTGKVDTPPTRIKDETLNESVVPEDGVTGYLSVLQSQDNKYRK